VVEKSYENGSEEEIVKWIKDQRKKGFRRRRSNRGTKDWSQFKGNGTAVSSFKWQQNHNRKTGQRTPPVRRGNGPPGEEIPGPMEILTRKDIMTLRGGADRIVRNPREGANLENCIGKEPKKVKLEPR